MVNSTTWIPDRVLMLVFVLQMLSFNWKILIMLMSQFPLTFHHIHNGMPCFISQLMTILVMIGIVFMIILGMFHERIYVNSVLLLLPVNFVSGVRLKQENLSSKVSGQASVIFMFFSCLCCCHSSQKSLFFFLYQKYKSSESKEKFRHASSRCERVLEAAKLACANKTRVHQFLDTQLLGLLANCQQYSQQR